MAARIAVAPLAPGAGAGRISGLLPWGARVDLKVPIKINDELSEDIVASTGVLDLASGEIHRIEYQDWDLAARGVPFEADDYEFTSGTLSHQGKEVEFTIHVNKVTGQYSVSASELLEIKMRAAALFSGAAAKVLTDPAAAAWLVGFGCGGGWCGG
jgi:hypothetical protein